jgi:hypothetical protein
MDAPTQIAGTEILAWRDRLLSLKRRTGRGFDKYASLSLRHPSWLLMFVFGRVLAARSLHRLLTRREKTECEPGSESLFPEADAAARRSECDKTGSMPG